MRSQANEPLTGAVASGSALDLVDLSHLSGYLRASIFSAVTSKNDSCALQPQD